MADEIPGEETRCAATLHELQTRREHGGLRGRVALASYAARHAGDLVASFRVLRALPTYDVVTSPSPQGEWLRALTERRTTGVTRRRLGVSVLDLPDTIEDYLRGKQRQAVRTNVSRARRTGLTTVALDDVAAREQAIGVVLAGRRDDPDWYPERLLVRARNGRDEMFAVRDAHGTTLALAVITVDTEWANLGWLLSTPGDDRAGDARYLLTVDVNAQLIARGVRHLMVEASLLLGPGLRYFQRRVGFTLANVRFAGASLTPGSRAESRASRRATGSRRHG